MIELFFSPESVGQQEFVACCCRIPQMKRSFDLVFVFLCVIIFSVPILVTSIVVLMTSKGPVLYWSNRTGRHNHIFKMPKFRTMYVNTPAVASHMLISPEQCLTPTGSFLRKSSLDELPQLWSILKGDMSFVGPRPALFNQYDLIELRTEKGLHELIPGLTGWAQVNGRDALTVQQKVELDAEYLQYKSFWLDIKILWLTFIKVLRCDGVLH
jgi:O-antigen biosynthesis protein WbqP